MIFSSVLLASTAVLTSLVSASPLIARAEPPSQYYLQAKVQGKPDDCGTEKNDLRVYSYHTGAGLGDAALSANASVAMQAYYNASDSQQYFTYPGNQIGGWPLAVQNGPYQGKLREEPHEAIDRCSSWLGLEVILRSLEKC
jgi:hypothetical protein